MREASYSTAKTIQSLEQRVEAGDYYEAQQTYKARYARLVSGKKYEDALDLVQSGACAQLKHGQITCGTELGVLLVETFRKAGTPYESTARDRIISIYKEFPRVDVKLIKASSESGAISEDVMSARTRVEGCTTFLKAAIKWSADSSGSGRGDPLLHHLLANYIWSQSPVPEFGKASLHFVRGDCPEAFAQAILACIDKCYPGEADLVITRSILQYLSMGYLQGASVLWDQVKGRSAENFPDSPLLHFVYFLIQCLERKALPLFKMLRQTYKPSINRDPTFDEYLDEIAERFFDVRPKNGLHGMLGDIMKMFGDT